MAGASGASGMTGTERPWSHPGGRVFAGLLFDGRTAVAHSVQVRLRPEGLLIEPETGHGQDFWPHASLVSNGPLLAGEPVVVGLKDRPGARLQVDDPTFRDLLLAQAPQLGTKAQRARQRRDVLAVLGVVAALFVIFFVLPVPWARMGATLVPDAAWQAMGERLRPLLATRVCARDEGLAALRILEARLRAGMAAAGMTERQSRIQVAELPMVNAFTLPGGQIVVSSALVRKAGSPEEVAGVIAHEIGHVLARHPEASLIRALGMTGLLSVLTGGSGMAESVMHLVMLKYSRDAEREADRLAMEILRGAEVDPVALARFFERMMKAHGEPPAVLSTHPPGKARMRLFRALSGQWPMRPVLDDRAWKALKRICQ